MDPFVAHQLDLASFDVFQFGLGDIDKASEVEIHAVKYIVAHFTKVQNTSECTIQIQLFFKFSYNAQIDCLSWISPSIWDTEHIFFWS